MSANGLPQTYVDLNTLQTKKPMIVVKIDGWDYLLTSGPLFSEIVYGGAGVIYDDDLYVYGGLAPYGKFYPYLSLDQSSITLQQRLEPEQGKASVSTLSLSFIDKNDLMTQLISPGVIIPDILLAQVDVYLGFENSSYPVDYFKIFRGYVSNIIAGPGLITLQLSDANLKSRTTLFYTAQSELTAPLSSTEWFFSVENNGSFHKQIIQPDGSSYSKNVHTYVQIDDEIIECTPIIQENERYRLFLNGLQYVAAKDHSTDVSVQYTGGGTAGAEVVTVTGSAIVVQIQAGVSTATDIFNALTQSESAQQLLSFYLVPSFAATAQIVTAQTYLALSTYFSFIYGGIVYIQQSSAAGVTITYVGGATAGSEFVSIVGSAITVHIANGVSTALQVYNALVAAGNALKNLVTFQLLAFAEPNLQSTFGSSPVVSNPAGTQFAVTKRGARNTVAAIHADTTGVAAEIQIGDSVNRENIMLMALKLYLSGWGGDWIRNLPIGSIGLIPDPYPVSTTTDAIVLPPSSDAIKDFNLAPGDFIHIYGSTNPATNNTYRKVVRLGSTPTGSNDIIFIDQQIEKEAVTTATFSIRSQFDCYPFEDGLMLKPTDVDIYRHLYILETFLGNASNDMIFFITASESSGKDFIQTQIYFPAGAYGLTRYGLLSVGYNSPPIANQNIVVLNENNVLDPQNIKPIRGANSRNFFNEIDFSYGLDDAGNYTKVLNQVSAPSLSRYSGYTNVLPVQSNGIYADYSVANLTKYATFLLNKYAFGAITMVLKVNWEAGSVIETGDIVLIDDSNGTLQISNMDTGARGLGRQLFNVIDRTFDLRQGNVSITVQSNVGATVQDRFGTISPSSHTDVGSTATEVIIKDSFGALFPGDEGAKWENYFGLPVVVHSADYSVTGTALLIGVDPSNPYRLLLGSSLGFSPPADYVVDIPPYPTSTDPNENALYKLMHDFLSPTVPIVTGIDQRNFTVSGGNAGKFLVGATVRIHSSDYAIDSGELTVTMVVGTTITVNAPIGFTPSPGQFVDLIGFADHGYAYRIL